jgi:hypothetical protein
VNDVRGVFRWWRSVVTAVGVAVWTATAMGVRLYTSTATATELRSSTAPLLVRARGTALRTATATAPHPRPRQHRTSSSPASGRSTPRALPSRTFLARAGISVKAHATGSHSITRRRPDPRWTRSVEARNRAVSERRRGPARSPGLDSRGGVGRLRPPGSLSRIDTSCFGSSPCVKAVRPVCHSVSVSVPSSAAFD